jgi:hypothetical protein
MIVVKFIGVDGIPEKSKHRPRAVRAIGGRGRRGRQRQRDRRLPHRNCRRAVVIDVQVRFDDGSKRVIMHHAVAGTDLVIDKIHQWSSPRNAPGQLHTLEHAAAVASVSRLRSVRDLTAVGKRMKTAAESFLFLAAVFRCGAAKLVRSAAQDS